MSNKQNDIYNEQAMESIKEQLIEKCIARYNLKRKRLLLKDIQDDIDNTKRAYRQLFKKGNVF